MEKKEIKTTVYEYTSVKELDETDQELIEKSLQAAKTAYAPYSNFKVGAAILLGNGKIIIGNNQENAAYPSGLCAERVALFHANSIYPNTKVKAIAISALNKGIRTNMPVPPCGSCRQALIESEIRFKQPIKIILVGTKKVQIVENSKTLLPLSFSDQHL